MSGATGAADGTGADGRQGAAPLPDAVGGVRGPGMEAGPSGPHDSHQGNAYQSAHQGGTTVTVGQQQAYGGAGAPQEPPPHQPPQAYAPPRPELGPAAVRQPRPAARTAPRTRKARLRVAKADPWSVMKVSFLLSIALGICSVVAVSVLWMVLDAIGVFGTVGETISEATGSGTDGGFDLQSFLSLSRVLIFTSVIAVIDVVLVTALATLAAFIYNMSAGFVGGVELTLAEDE